MSQEHSETPQEGKKRNISPERQKSVIIYILLLFVVAFLLMGFSLLTHQRDNTEALGQLKDSITAMKDAQTLQDQVVILQTELSEARETASALESAGETARDQAEKAEETLKKTQAAMDLFWQPNEAYVREDAQQCAQLIQELQKDAEDPLEGYLSEKARTRYEEILAAQSPEEPAG